MSHEKSKESQMTSYFSNKFYPALPIFTLGRSYKADPQCKAEESLFDNWMDRSHSQV